MTVHGTEIQKISQNFILFSKFSKKGTLRGTDFSIFVFLRPLVLVKVKNGTLTNGASRTPFCPSYPPPGLPSSGLFSDPIV